jgi:hypothetical protein
MDPADSELVLFKLQRHEDESGVSGTGTVAYGIKFPDPNSRVALGWIADDGYTSVAVYDDLADLERIHSHGGKTEIVPIDVIDTY